MRSLLNFLKKYSNIILFILLEAVAIYLLAARPNVHNIRISRMLNSVTSTFSKQFSSATEYFSLKEINQQLLKENRELKNAMQRIYNTGEIGVFSANDSLYRQQYFYIQSRVVNNSVNKQKNYITLNKGTLNGVKADMAVAGPDGIVGITVEAGKNYSVAMSALNLDFRLSGRIKNSGYFGSLSWDGVKENILKLTEIPQHVDIAIGDTIETTGYSAIFPEGLMVGTISEYDTSSGDFYDIRVKLSTQFRKLNHVYVITNLKKEEQIETEEEIQAER